MTLIAENLREAAETLRRPFEPKSLKFKVQSNVGPKENPTGGIVVAYLDRGLVIDRLNVVVPDLWSTEFTDLGSGHMLCAMTIDGVTRSDVGESGTPKGRYSDSLKRAAVHFGVGVSLSRVPMSILNIEDKSLKAREYNGKTTLTITQKGLDSLRARYEYWLDEVGKTAFGEPLSHGDLGDAQGDDEISDEHILDDSSAVALYVSLSQTGLLPRQQVGLLNQVGATISATAKADEIATVVSSLTEDQALELDKLISERM